MQDNKSSEQNNVANQQPMIDLKALWNRLWDNRKIFYWALPITFVVSTALILCVPKTYECTIILAPESQDTKSNSLASLASSFGFSNLGGLMAEDAINSAIYPEVLASPDFIMRLFDTPVSTIDGGYKGTYYNYLKTYQHAPFWKHAKQCFFRMISKKDNIEYRNIGGTDSQKNEFLWFTKEQHSIIDAIKEYIVCNVDKKTNLVRITTTAQDPVVCAIIAQTIQEQLQMFTIAYRTQKAQADIDYYTTIIPQSKAEYEEASAQYIAFVDAHTNTTQQRYRVELNNLQGEMDTKYTAYTTLQKQLMASKAKLQENTPVFTTIQSANVPQRAAKPHRASFVLFMCMLVFCGISFWLTRDLFHISL